MTKAKMKAEIKNKLFSANTNEVVSALSVLKEEGNKEYLPLLFDLLLANPEPEVEQEILKLLGTIKDKETVPAFITALKDPKYIPIRKVLLSSCWQNGLDFTNHFDTIVDLVIEEEWEVAFEAFTILENLEHFPPEEIMKDIKLKVARALKSANEQKGYFLEEILKMSSH